MENEEIIILLNTLKHLEGSERMKQALSYAISVLENLPSEEELYKFIHNWLCKRHGIEYNGILARDLAHTIINKNGGAREGIRQDQSESETST